MGIINTDFTMPGQDMPPQNFRDLKTQQGQINWLAQFLMSVNNVFDNVSGSVTTLAEDQSAYVEITFDDENNTATFDFYLPRGYRGYPGSMESVTATASTLAPGSSATVSVTLDQPTQSLAFSFGLPEGTPATDAQTASAVAAWIEAHPEAVTTVQDGAVSTVKLADGAVTFAKLASDVKAILAGKADLVSYAPLLTAGVAESLLSSDEQQATFIVQESKGASVGVLAILGNTEAVNNDLVSVNIEGLRGIGFNQWDEVTENGYWDAETGQKVNSGSWVRCANPITVMPNTDYYFKVSVPSSGSFGRVIYLDSAMNVVDSVTNSNLVANKVITTPSNTRYIVFYMNQTWFADPICINLSDPSRNGTYEPYQLVSERAIDIASHFPDGLRGAGNVHDELQRNNAITRVGSVDMGTLNWSYQSNNSRFVSSTAISDAKATGGADTVSNITCAQFEAASPNGTAGNYRGERVSFGSTDTLIRVQTNRWTNAEAFKTSMDGVMLYYELATPTTTQINPPINMDYQTQAGGTEQIIIPTGEQSAAPTFVYVQGYDANGIADKALGVIATVEGDTASTNYAIGSFFVHAGKLYKATSAIASGETITPGTNCTQTTVMAEILALG